MSGRMEDRRLDLADQFVRRFAAAVRSAQLYSARHPIIARNVEALSAAIDVLHASQPMITVGIVGSEVVVGDVPVGKAEALGDVIRRLQSAGIERIVMERGISADEVTGLVQALASTEARRTSSGGPPDFPTFPHIRVGRIQVEDRVEGNLADMATIRRLYADAVSIAGLVWESASAEHQPDATASRAMIDGLGQPRPKNRTRRA